MLSAFQNAAQETRCPHTAWCLSRRPAMAEGECLGDQISLRSLFIPCTVRKATSIPKLPPKRCRRGQRAAGKEAKKLRSWDKEKTTALT